MKFKTTHVVFGCVQEFSDTDAPSWITGENTIAGSTMDDRWFWTEHVLKLEVGGTIETDFHVIERIE